MLAVRRKRLGCDPPLSVGGGNPFMWVAAVGFQAGGQQVPANRPIGRHTLVPASKMQPQEATAETFSPKPTFQTGIGSLAASSAAPAARGRKRRGAGQRVNHRIASFAHMHPIPSFVFPLLARSAGPLARKKKEGKRKKIG